jgi:signal peptidase I
MGGMFRVGPCCLGALFLLLAGTATSQEPARWIRGIYAGESPRPIVQPLAKAWQEASALAGRTPDSLILVGGGKSMQPLYQPGTILVLRQIPYTGLKRGQTVLYRNRQQKVVAHVLVARTRDGWRAQGLNNPQHDMEPILAGNLVGVVFAAYLPVADGPLLEVASAR